MIRVLASGAAALAIAAGAFAAHGLAGQPAEWLKTGSFYLLVHAIAVVAFGAQHKMPARLLLAGAGLFAATLYAMALGAPRWLGAITPFGGTAMILGWLWLAMRLRRD